jgi:hypothetical protein
VYCTELKEMFIVIAKRRYMYNMTMACVWLISKV